MAPKTTTARPSLATLSARVTGFHFMYASFHAYTTVVTLDGTSWSLGIRYSKFLALYEALKAADRSFKFDFPPRGGLFSKPKPEDRQVRLNAFLQAVTKFCQAKQQPRNVANLVSDLLQVDRNYTRANKFPSQKESAPTLDKREAQVASASKPLLADMALDGTTVQVKAATVVAASKDKATDATHGDSMATQNKMKDHQDNGNTSEVTETNDNVSVEQQQGKEIKTVVQDVTNDKKVCEGAVATKLKEHKEDVEVQGEVEIEGVAIEQKVTAVNLEGKEPLKAATLALEDELKATPMGEDEQSKVVEVDGVQEVQEEAVTADALAAATTRTTRTTTTTTTTMGSTVMETNVVSQASANKTVVGKTVTITSKLDDTHSFKVEMTENKASVVTLTSALKQMKEEQHKAKKKKRSGRRQSMSSAPSSTVSTASDGFESPDGVDQLGRVSDLPMTEAQKKARNQRRKEKRKKNQKKLK